MSQESNVPPPPQDPPAPPPPPPQSPPPQSPPPQSPPPQSPPPATGGSSNKTVMLVLSYLGLLALIPLLTEKDDADIQWHAKHGLMLMLTSFAIWFGWMILSWVTADFCTFGCLTMLVGLALSVGILIVHVMAIMKAIKGERLNLPILTDLVDKF